LDWIALDWIALDWIALDWIALDWIVAGVKLVHGLVDCSAI